MLDPLNISGVRAATRKMRPGMCICYHRGYLLLDRREDARLGAIADWFLSIGLNEDLGFLTQRKEGKFDYEYLFTKK